MPRPARRGGVRAVRAPAGMPPLARPPRRPRVTAALPWVVVVVLAVLVGLTALALWRAVARLGAPEAARQQPGQALPPIPGDTQTPPTQAPPAPSETVA